MKTSPARIDKQTSPQRKSGYRRFPQVPALDGVRGLAAVAVVAHHCLSASVSGISFSPHVQSLHVVASYLYLGVDLFFVLSGYLITSLLILARRQDHFYSNFYIKRAFRILPALLLVLGLTRLLFNVPWAGIAMALLFVANISFTWGIAEIGPYWSLSIEEQFYLLWPTVIHRIKARTVYRIVILLIAAAPILRAVSAALHHGNDRYTPLHCDGLAWGALIALLGYRARIPFRNAGAVTLWRNGGRWILSCGLVAVAVAVFLLETGHVDYGMLLTASAPTFAGCLLYLLTHRNSWIAALLRSGPLRFLGDISYMLYLSHAYIMTLYDVHGPSLALHHTGRALLFRFFVVLALSVLWSAASLYFFEKPVMNLRRFFLRSS